MDAPTPDPPDPPDPPDTPDPADPPEHDEHGRPEPPLAGGEAATLVGFLEYQRATLAWKVDGLDGPALAATTAASTLTLGGLVKHLTWVEDHWFSRRLLGREPAPLFRDVDFRADPDWEFRTAADHRPDELLGLWHEAVERSRRDVQAVLATEAGLDARAVALPRDPRRPSLRWILVHMVEEYARHNGHADLLREAVDGATGE